MGALVAAGRAVWTVDLAYSVTGRGARQDFTAVVDSVRRGIDALEKRDGPVDGVGHSLGGHVLLALAATSAPLRRIATVATALDYRRGGSGWKALAPLAKLGRLEPRRRASGGGIPVELLSGLTWPLFGRAVRMPMEANNFAPGATDGEVIRSVVAGSMRDIPLPLLASVAGLVLDDGLTWGEPRRSLTEAAASLDLPVLVIGGRQDRQCPIEAVRHAAEVVPGARLIEVGEPGEGRGYGHYDVVVGRRAPAEVFAPIAEFLRG